VIAELWKALREDFYIFLRKAFAEVHPAKDFQKHPYIEYLCYVAARVEAGDITRTNVNIPARHLKTFIFSKAFPAWLLGRQPASEVMIITGNEPLAKEIPYAIRAIMQMPWYKEVFATRIAVDRSRLLDFATSAGGGCFTRPMGASIVGRGGDVIIIDDAIDPKDAANESHVAAITEYFETGITTRLNNFRRSRVLIIGHRVSENDLSGHVLKQGGWFNVALPLVATSNRSFEMGGKVWRRKKGELLQLGSRTKQELRSLRENTKSPDFDTLYQQNPSGELSRPITADCFPSFDKHSLRNVAVVLSIDPGQEISESSSFSVIQVWCRQESRHYLMDLWRGRLEFRELFSMCRQFHRKHRASAVLIERAALGSALISEARQRHWKGLVAVVPDGRSKLARFRPHADTIRKGNIHLPTDAPWRDDFVQEVITFPHGRSTDQVDAMTQYLAWSKERGELPPVPERIPSILVRSTPWWRR
jgi:predicted phage terminase large subunit-like protein